MSLAVAGYQTRVMPYASKTSSADTMVAPRAFGVFDGLYEPDYLDRLRSSERA